MYPLSCECACRLLVLLHSEPFRNQFFGGMEMGLHLSDWMKACQSKRWPQACAHARDVIGRNWINPSNKKKSQRPKTTNCSWNDFPQTKFFFNKLYWKQLLVKFVLFSAAYYLSFSPRGKSKLVSSRFFLPLEPWTKTVLLCTIPISDEPVLLDFEPNTSIPFE